MRERWSEKIPTAPGLYWHIGRYDKEAHFVKIDWHGDELAAWYMGWDISRELEPGLWMKARKPSPPAQPKDYRR